MNIQSNVTPLRTAPQEWVSLREQHAKILAEKLFPIPDDGKQYNLIHACIEQNAAFKILTAEQKTSVLGQVQSELATSIEHVMDTWHNGMNPADFTNQDVKNLLAQQVTTRFVNSTVIQNMLQEIPEIAQNREDAAANYLEYLSTPPEGAHIPGLDDDDEVAPGTYDFMCNRPDR